jgi:ABC-type bacteriocin/lantibiotic exporter with double-glycine peptidase domain
MPGSLPNVPHFKQEFNHSCIPACVRMVLAYHGYSFSEDELRQLMGTGPHGTYARDILRISSLGFDVHLRAALTSELRAGLASGTPPIVFLATSFLDYWNMSANHVAVVVALDSTNISLNDPYFDTAPQQVAMSSFQQAWAANGNYAAFIRPRP